MKRFLFVLIAALTAFSGNVWAEIEVYNPTTETYESLDDFAKQSSPKAFYILGEYHYNEVIQKAQAETMKKIVEANFAASQFDMAWEFMNFNDKDEQVFQWTQVLSGKLGIPAFFALFGQQNSSSYQPIFQVAKDLKAHYFGVNAPRTIKSQIIKGGLNSVDPKWIPPRVEVGGDNYLERFEEAMGGHVGGDVLKSYFLAQCYTDSVMAHYLNEYSKNDLSFLVVGSFHNDYRDGTVVRLEGLTSRPVISLKFVNAAELTADQLDKMKKPHPVYGEIADYIVISM
jgi:uncharacterized iron-regulated protein